MTRTFRATVLAALAVVLTAVPAHAAASPTGTAGRSTAPPVTVRDSRLQLTPPLATRPMDEQCAVGGFNHPFCGRVVLEVTLAGFDAYGGVPACTDPDDCSAEAPLATSTGGRARVDVLVRCTGEWFPRVRSLPVVVEAGPGPSDVSPASRVGSDAARLVFSFLLPGPTEIGACGPGATLLGAEVVRSLSLDFTGTAAGVPSWTTRLPGVHRVPLGR